jgi:STE24 endopeptidase
MFILLIAAYLLIFGFRCWLLSLNLKHLKAYGKTVPTEFEGVIDPDRLGRISAYTLEKSRIGIVESVLGSVIMVVFFFGGVLGAYDRWIGSMTGSFLSGGLLFFLFLLCAEMLLDIPFSLYRNFRIENKYGFNTMSLRLWAADLAKSALISAILGGIVVAGALAIVQGSPAQWWLWVWAFFLAFSIFVMYLAPYVIEPLFFKFEPLRAEGLEDKVRELMERAGLKVSRVFQVDASRRSRHSNAYFTGIGRVKRIVLFDTLLEQMSHDEILAVLAHEVGHWKKRHVLKGIVLTEALALIGLYLAYQLVSWNGLPGLTGLSSASFYARTLILGFVGSLVAFPLTPLFASVSRRYENEADRFAAKLTRSPEALASGLVKLSSENLSNLHPHPLYAKFYYSHPPVVERIRALKERGTKDDRR